MTINKAIVAFLSSAAALLASFGLDVTWLTPERIMAIATIVTPALVYLIPNKG